MAVATNAAAKAFPPPSSAFGKLLRRSRFASYDPAIAQTYTSPQAHARRGDYGLKRPIPMRYKDSYITVNQFEHHAQFAEWNNAEPLVSLVKRVEELNLTPRAMSNGMWYRSLGEAGSQWVMDSEFAATAERTIPVDGLGRRGQGAYGARRPPPQQYHADSTPATVPINTSQVNVMSLSPRQFKRYINKLRELGPEYREYILEQQKARLVANLQAEPSTPLTQPKKQVPQVFQEDDAVLLVAAQSQFNPHKFHRPFLAKHFSVTSPPAPTNKNKKITTPTVAISQNVERQPHRSGGLMYTHYSPLETVLTTKPQPGFVLQNVNATLYHLLRSKTSAQVSDYVALLGGLVVVLNRTNAATHLPFYNPEHDIAVGGRDPKALADAAAAAAFAATTEGKDEPKSEPEISTVFAKPPAPPSEPPVDPTDPLRVKRAAANLRMLSVFVRSPPTVSTYKSHLSHPKDILKSLALSADSAVDLSMRERFIGGNPYRIGSMEYSGHAGYSAKNRFNRTEGAYAGYGGVYKPGNAGAVGAAMGETYLYGVSYTNPKATPSTLDDVVAQGARYGRRNTDPKWGEVFPQNREKEGMMKGNRSRASAGAGTGTDTRRGGSAGAGYGKPAGNRKDRRDGEGVKDALQDMIRRSGFGEGANGKGGSF